MMMMMSSRCNHISLRRLRLLNVHSRFFAFLLKTHRSHPLSWMDDLNSSSSLPDDLRKEGVSNTPVIADQV